MVNLSIGPQAPCLILGTALTRKTYLYFQVYTKIKTKHGYLSRLVAKKRIYILNKVRCMYE